MKKYLKCPALDHDTQVKFHSNIQSTIHLELQTVNLAAE